MLQKLFKGLRDLIYPNCCLVCKNKVRQTDQQELICSSCWDKIEQNLPPFCFRCGRHLTPEAIEKNTCLNCSEFNFDRAFSPCRYTGVIKKLIHEFKYSGKDYLGKPLGKLMQTFIRDYQLPIAHLDFIIPDTLHKNRQREREFNQAEILSHQVTEEFSKQVLTSDLMSVKHRQTQTKVNFQEG